MSGDDSGIPRRTFLKGIGLTAAAAAVGPGLGSAEQTSIDERFLNWRAVEAQKVWERGLRGRRDRTLALTDSGVEGRHPDLGPWNGVRAEIQDGEFTLTRGTGDDGAAEYVPVTDDAGEPLTESDSGTFTLGAFAAPNEQLSEVKGTTFTAKTDGSLDAELSWTPPGNDLEFRIDDVTEERTEVGRAATADNPETLRVDVTEGRDYQFVVELYASAAGQYTVNATYVRKADGGSSDPEPADSIEPFGDVDDPLSPDPDTPKTIGWHTSGDYGGFEQPLDQNGHGTHCSSIMAGSGRASTIERSTVHEPGATLLPGDFLEFEVEDVDAGQHVWASAFGTNVNLYIVDPEGRELDESPVRKDSIILEQPVEKSGTYTVQVRPRETQAEVEGVAEQAQAGNPTAGTLERIAVGTTKHAAGTTGQAVPDGQSLHPGVAPNAGIVGLQGLGAPTTTLGEHAAAFKEAFNIRAVNMSWGPLQGAPLGQVEQLDSTRADVRKITEGGMLVCASAGNSFTPANGNGGPAAADEAISVVATGPFDGISTYSSGGIGGVDEQSDGSPESSPVYMKPDVTAPGGDIGPDALANIGLGLATNPPIVGSAVDLPVGVGYPVPSIYELARAAKNDDPSKTYGNADDTADSSADEPFAPRDFTDKAGTSMSAPYTNGMAGLVAQAMEDGLPEQGVRPEALRLPAPAETGEQDIYRLKSIILATASESVFTAAPYHAAQNPPKAPTYDFGGRDPFEGYGRINPAAAVDAVTRDLTPAVDDDGTGSLTTSEELGLYVPEDSRAVAGYVEVPAGALEVSVSLSHLSGGNRGMAAGDPHIDLFVYDPANPTGRGEPSIIARAQGLTGAPSTTVSVPGEAGETTTYVVVAKLVNVPGVVNGHDVQSHFDLTVDIDATLERFGVAGGSRTDDGRVFTAGATDQVDLSVTDPDGTATVRDVLPAAWEVVGGAVDRVDQPAENGPKYVYLDGEAAADSTTEYTYFVEAPDAITDSDRYTFGPAEARPADATDAPWATVPGTSDTNTVIAVGTNPPSGDDLPGGDPPV